jgi:hypothetical protein
MANINKSQPQFHNTFGREPTVNTVGKKDKEGNTSAKIGKGGLSSDDEDRMTQRAAQGFKRDVAKRSSRVRGRRKRGGH